MALSPAEQAALDQKHFRDFTAARGLNPGAGPAPGGYNVNMPQKPSYNTASWLNQAPGMQASSFGLNAPPPPTMGERMGQWSKAQPAPPKVDVMVEGLTRAAANPPPISASEFGPPRPEYPGTAYGPFRRADTHAFTPEAQAWQQGVREPYTAPGGPPTSAPTARPTAPGLMKEVLAKPPTAAMRGLGMVGNFLTGPVSTALTAVEGGRQLERAITPMLSAQEAAGMGLVKVPENPAARSPADIYQDARGMNPSPRNIPRQDAADVALAALNPPPRPESPSGPVGPTIPTAPLGLPSAATTETVNRSLAGEALPAGLGQPRQPIPMSMEAGGPSTEERLRQMDLDLAQAEAARTPDRLRVGGLNPGQGVIQGADGRTWQFDGKEYSSFAPDGTLLSRRGADAEPNAADREAAMARSAEATKFMDRERAAADYRANINRAMEYQNPIQRAMLLKAASDGYQTRVGGIPTAQTDAELQKQTLANQGGIQQQEMQNQGGLAVAKQQGLTQQQIHKIQQQGRIKSERIKAEAKAADVAAREELADRERLARNLVDPETGQSMGQEMVPRYEPRQKPQPLEEIQSQAQYLLSAKPHLRATIVERLKKAGIDPSFLKG